MLEPGPDASERPVGPPDNTLIGRRRLRPPAGSCNSNADQPHVARDVSAILLDPVETRLCAG
jgi:hypothetical protein